MKCFADLTEQELLALAISSEEEDSRVYRDFAQGLRSRYPQSAEMLGRMAEEEIKHHGWLFKLYQKKFGDHVPLVRRQDVKGFVRHRPVWLVQPLGLDQVRKYAETIEYENARFYRRAAEQARDLRCAIFWRVSRKPKRDMSGWRNRWRAAFSRRSRAPRRMRQRGACSCSNTCSRGSPA